MLKSSINGLNRVRRSPSYVSLNRDYYWALFTPGNIGRIKYGKWPQIQKVLKIVPSMRVKKFISEFEDDYFLRLNRKC